MTTVTPDLTRTLAALHAVVGLVVVAGGLAVADGLVATPGTWSAAQLDLAAAALAAAGLVVIVLAAVTHLGRRTEVVHGAGLGAALVSAAGAVPLTLVLGVTGWLAVGAVPLAVVSVVGLLDARLDLRGLLDVVA